MEGGVNGRDREGVRGRDGGVKGGKGEEVGGAWRGGRR